MTPVELAAIEARASASLREIRAEHIFQSGTAGDGVHEPQETWEGCSCGVLYDEWQQHVCPEDCPCRDAEPVDIPTAHAEHLLSVALRARLVGLAALRERDNTIARVRAEVEAIEGLSREPLGEDMTSAFNLCLRGLRAALDPQETE
ncbi:hypothetical protein [Rhodococcus sp. MALMAid1271]|uniref:hypothetical protein n=1 Tax=Rhodococcus sp. MALMAid1271 TaxID=3411744 RepID=UPI003BA15E05